MRRRNFIALLGSLMVMGSLAVNAQESGGMRRIGVLMSYPETDPDAQAFLAAFREGLQKLGWTEGRNVRLDTRWTSASAGNLEEMQRFAKELVALQPDLLLGHTTTTTTALQKQTHTIPIIFAFVSDPIGSGLVTNFPHPGGNVTGFMVMEPTMAGKWLELLKEIAPRVALLFNPATAAYAEYYLKPFKAAAASLAVEATALPVHDTSELESVIATYAREPNGGLVVMPDTFNDAHRADITSLAARYQLPLVCPLHFYAEVGCLLSYGPLPIDNFRRAAQYADRILKGERPSDLPVQAPVNFVLTINLKAAKALGLNVPALLQQRADEVTE
jgi:putative tryptophan/tyrosine transport system substrate-binding protein